MSQPSDDATALAHWFRRNGLPHAYPDYSPTRNVLNRMVPYLGLIWFCEMFLAFNGSISGLAQAGVFVGGALVLVGAYVALNLMLRRPPLARPESIGAVEIIAWVVTPAVIPTLVGRDPLLSFANVTVGNILLLGIGYFITSYGLLPALRVGAQQSLRHVTQVMQLISRGLPLLLLITVFVFLNAEMWQVAHDFTPGYFAAALGMLLGLAFLFLMLRLPKEVEGIGRFDTWSEVTRLSSQSGCPECVPLVPDSGAPPTPDFDRYERFNIGLLLSISQVVQLAMVGLGVMAFYIAFGVVTVREETISQWVASTPTVLLRIPEAGVFLTVEHVVGAGFVAAFSVLQFAVSSTTDAVYREEFFADVTSDVRKVLAVRARVRAQLRPPA